MKVLHVAAGNLYGGVEAMLSTIARYRALCPEMEPSFLLCYEDRIHHELSESGVTVHLADAPRLSRPWKVYAARRRLRRLVHDHRYDWVVCHSAWPLAVFGSAVEDTHARLGLWLHDRIDGARWLWKLAGRTTPERIVCNSRFTASTVSKLFSGTPSEVIHCPVPEVPPLGIAAREEIRGSLSTHATATVIVQASRLERWKGHELHLRALGGLADLPGWVCWIAGGAQLPGEEAYLARLRRLAADLGIENRVRFLGHRTDVPRLLAAADIHCQPNQGAEPFGIAFVEAMSAGLPCVTTALGGALEILDESCGVLVQPDDAPALAAAIRELVTNPERRSEMGAAGMRRARTLCDPERQLSHLHRVLADDLCACIVPMDDSAVETGRRK